MHSEGAHTHVVEESTEEAQGTRGGGGTSCVCAAVYGGEGGGLFALSLSPPSLRTGDRSKATKIGNCELAFYHAKSEDPSKMTYSIPDFSSRT